MRATIANTWLHSLVLIAIATPVVALALGIAATTLPEWHETARVFACLAPGLVLGWFTRRHPLLVGAAVGLLAVALLAGVVPAMGSPGPVMLTALMLLGVATLAGRALRLRFQPSSR